MEITEFQLLQLVSKAADLAAMNTLIQTGLLKPYLNKSEAFSQFGRKNVEKWIKAGLVTPRKDGGHSAAWRLDRMEMELLVAVFDLQRTLPAILNWL